MINNNIQGIQNNSIFKLDKLNPKYDCYESKHI